MAKYQRRRVTAFTDDIQRREEEARERFLERISSDVAKLKQGNSVPPASQLPSPANPGTGGLPDHDHSRTGKGGATLGDPTRVITGRGQWAWDVSGKLGINVANPQVRLHVQGPNNTLNAMRPTGGGSGGAGPDWTPSTGASLSDMIDDPIIIITDTSGDGDWIISSTSSSSAGSINFTTIPDPGVDTGWVFRYRYQKTIVGTGNVTWSLKQGVTVIESWTDTPDPGNTLAIIPVSHALNPVNIANVVFPLVTPLHMEMSPGGAAGQQGKIFVWFLEVPGGGSGDEDMVKIQGGSGQTHDWLQLLLSTGEHWGLKLPAAVTNHSWVLPGTQGAANSFLKNDGAGNLSWDTAPGAHNLLSATHPDTVPQAPTKGGLIVGKTTPSALWDKLAVGTDGFVLTADSAQTLGVKWAALPATTNTLLDGANHTDTTNSTVVRGDLIVGNSTPKWTRKAIGSNKQAVVSDGTDVQWASLDNTYLADRTRRVSITPQELIQSNGTSMGGPGIIGSYPNLMEKWAFVDAPGTSPQAIYFSWVIPKDYVSGLTLYVVWGPSSAAPISDNNIVVNAKYKNMNPTTPDLYDVASVTTVRKVLRYRGLSGDGVPSAGDTNNPKEVVIASVGDISTSAAIDKILRLNLERDSTDGTDDAAFTMHLYGIILEYTADM